MSILAQLWKDDAGFIVSTELVLVATILVIGLIVGLTTVRDQVVQELGDMALAIGSVNMSYAYTGVMGHTSAVAGSDYEDQPDFCEISEAGTGDQPGLAPACIDLELGPIDEGTGL